LKLFTLPEPHSGGLVTLSVLITVNPAIFLSPTPTLSGKDFRDFDHIESQLLSEQNILECRNKVHLPELLSA